MATMTREDLHRPSVMDPADYEFIGGMDEHEEDGFFEFDFAKYADLTGESIGEDPGAIRWAVVRHTSSNFTPEGDHFWRNWQGGCDHCGTRGIRYWTLFLHTPSREVVAVGSQCAAKMGLSSKGELKIRAIAERRAVAKRGSEWMAEREENSEAILFLMSQLEDESGSGMPFYIFSPDGSRILKTIRDEFYASVLRHFLSNGELSERQVEAVLQSKQRKAERDAQRAEEEKNDPEPAPVVEGRIEVVGRLATIKSQDSQFGETLKMLVIDDRGFRVWGTIPSSLIEALWRKHVGESDYYSRAGGDILTFLKRGVVMRVKFTATVEKSAKDETFGFFRRPTKASVVE